MFNLLHILASLLLVSDTQGSLCYSPMGLGGTLGKGLGVTGEEQEMGREDPAERTGWDRGAA